MSPTEKDNRMKIHILMLTFCPLKCSRSGLNIRSLLSSQHQIIMQLDFFFQWTTDQDLTDAIASVGVTDLVEIKFYENRANGQSKGYVYSFQAYRSWHVWINVKLCLIYIAPCN